MNKTLLSLVSLGASVWAASAAVVTFQEGVNGYTGTVDTYVRGASPSTIHDEIEVSADGADGGFAIDALIQFQNIYGGGVGQIPPTATIVSAQLVTRSITANSQSSSTYGLHRMLVPWDETSTWDSLINGVDVDDVEAASAADSSFVPSGSVPFSITNDVTAAVAAWHAGTAVNHGWVMNIISGTDGYDFASSESLTIEARPMLVVTYTAPAVPIEIVQQPQSMTTNEGGAVTFNVAALGDPRYQWYQNGVSILDATNSSLTLTDLTAANDGDYHVVLQNDLPDTKTSQTATLTVIPDTTPPRVVIAYAVDATTIIVRYSEEMDQSSVEEELYYYLENIADAGDVLIPDLAVLNPDLTSATLTVQNRRAGANYKLSISNVSDNSVAKNMIAIEDGIVPLHQFPITDAITTDSLTEWRYMEATAPGGWELPGFDDSAWSRGYNGFATGTGESLSDAAYVINTATLTAPSAGNVASYFRAGFQWQGATGISLLEFNGAVDDGAVIYVNGQEVARIRMPSGPISSSTLATGQGNGDPIHNLDGPLSVIVTNLLNGANTVAVAVHQNSTTSSDVMMALRLRASVPELPSGPPVFFVQPQGGVIPERGAHAFTARVTGEEPLTYQWIKDGLDIPGANGSSFSIANALPGDAGEYGLRVSNAVMPGGVLSDAANLVVLPDTNAPSFVLAIGDTDLTNFVLFYTDTVADAAASNPANYQIQLASGGGALTVLSAIITNGTNVVLTTAEPRVQGENYVLTTAGITDNAADPNPATPESRRVAAAVTLLQPDDATLWRYDQSGIDRSGEAWNSVGYDDSGWTASTAGFSTPGEIVPLGFEVRNTELIPQNAAGPKTMYYRVAFDYPFIIGSNALAWRGVVDDGAAFYVNATEVGRIRVNEPGAISYNTDAENAPETSDTHPAEGYFLLNGNSLNTGANLLAIELHQTGTNSSDSALSIQLVALVEDFVAPGLRMNITRDTVSGAVTISWTGSYCLQESSALDNAAWTGSAVQNGVPFSPTGPIRFYRLATCGE